MLSLILRSRRRFTSKIYAILFIVFCYIMIKTLYPYTRFASRPTSQIIIVNLKSSNNSVPALNAGQNPLEQSPSLNNQHVIHRGRGRNQRIRPGTSNERRQESASVVDDFERLIQEDEDKIISGLGEDGEPVRITPHANAEEVKRNVAKHAFNKLLSDQISYNRRLPDARHNLCGAVKYDEELPSASVVIIFVDEAWSTLIRTVHSVLKSPERYLKEIVLVDDASSKEDLNGKLDYYVKTRFPPKVKLLRLHQRSGLIKARLAGARIATGDVLVFLDAHCECVVDWLQPLLQRIKDSRETVVCPIIDGIDDNNLGYTFSNTYHFQIGGFTWSGHFTWIEISPLELKRRGSEIGATRSPTMAGGLFAIDRNFFWEIGAYDPEMEVWGGENLEMSFRIWQCGGSLEILPCSRVGHIFRSFHPYSFPGQKDTHGINTARMVEVWMDDYKRLFYMHRPDLKNALIGDVSARKRLRQELQCHNFEWFLKNVLPEKFILDEGVVAYGRVKSKTQKFCFDNLNQPEEVDHDLGIYSCHDVLYSTQYFSLTEKGELRREELCAEVHLKSIKIPKLAEGARGSVHLSKCTDNSDQLWSYDQEHQTIQHRDTGYCIHMYGAKQESVLTVTDCRETDVLFKWIWEYVKSTYNNTLVKNHLFK